MYAAGNVRCSVPFLYVSCCMHVIVIGQASQGALSLAIANRDPTAVYSVIQTDSRVAPKHGT